MSNVFTNAFALSTISVAILSWLIAFIGSIISDVRGGFPNYAWWSLVYMFFCIAGVFVTVASASEDSYRIAIVGYLGAGLVFTTSSVNSLVYSPDGAKEAAAAGFILLSMVAIVWMFVYGADHSSSARRFVDSYALNRPDLNSSHNSRQMSNNYGAQTQPVAANPAPQMYTSAQLNGFETSSPVSGYPGGPVGGGDRPISSQPRFGGAPLSTTQSQTPTNAPEPDISAPTEYPYRAKAIYSYEANPDDANEISFTKHEILEVSDVSGRWWQAKKENGETGIAPSNYLILL